jgi:hypothetical protein
MSFASIIGITFSFLQQARIPDAHTHLNVTYKETLTELDDIFQDSTTKTDLKPNAVDTITKKIIKSIETYATDTTDKNKVRTVITAAAKNIGHPGKNNALQPHGTHIHHENRSTSLHRHHRDHHCN